MNINMASIMKRVKLWSESQEGKARIGETIDGYRKGGVGKTAGGSAVLTDRDIEAEARKLANAIISTAISYDLPASVVNNISSLTCTKPYQADDGTVRVDFYFTADLHRPSLYDEVYDGIDNIIALFNNGYLAQDRVYGFWDGHKVNSLDEGGYLDTRSVWGGTFGDAMIRSNIAQPATLFMQKAIGAYMSGSGSSVGAKVVLDPIYEEVPTVAPIS